MSSLANVTNKSCGNSVVHVLHRLSVARAASLIATLLEGSTLVLCMGGYSVFLALIFYGVRFTFASCKRTTESTLPLFLVTCFGCVRALFLV